MNYYLAGTYGEDEISCLLPADLKSNWRYEGIHYTSFNNRRIFSIIEEEVDIDPLAVFRHPQIGSIAETIIEAITASDAIIAYLTRWDAAALVEIVTASALGKPVIAITRLFAECMGNPFIDPAGDSKMAAMYWLALNLPNVATVNAIDRDDVRDYIERYDKLESPIELQLGWAIDKHSGQNWYSQFSIGKYRADFAFPFAKLVVECDGHDYHKTKEQRTHDARRDRYMASQGWEVMRFTGTEIFKNAEQCAREAGDRARHLYCVNEQAQAKIRRAAAKRDKAEDAIAEGYLQHALAQD